MLDSATTTLRRSGFGGSVHVAQGIRASSYDLVSRKDRNAHLRTVSHRWTAAITTSILLGPGLYHTGSRSTQIGVFVARELGLSGYGTPYGPTEKPAVTYAQFSFRHFF